MNDKFNSIGLDCSVYPARTPAMLTRNFVNYISDEAKGCSQCHLDIWEAMIYGNVPYALILEDDACFDKEWLKKTNQFFTDINDTEWDLLMLNASESIDILNRWINVKEQYLAGGYIISLKGAKILYEMYKGCVHMSDWMLTRLQLYGHAYSYFPWIIIQEGIESTAGSNLDADHEKVVRCLKEIKYDIDNYI